MEKNMAATIMGSGVRGQMVQGLGLKGFIGYTGMTGVVDDRACASRAGKASGS